MANNGSFGGVLGLQGPLAALQGRNLSAGWTVTGPLTVTELIVKGLGVGVGNPKKERVNAVSAKVGLLNFQGNTITALSSSDLSISALGSGVVSISKCYIDNLIGYGGTGSGGTETIPATITSVTILTGTLGNFTFSNATTAISVTDTSSSVLWLSANGTGIVRAPTFLTVGGGTHSSSASTGGPLQVQSIDSAVSTNRTLTVWRGYSTSTITSGPILVAVTEQAPGGSGGLVIYRADGVVGVRMGGPDGTLSLTGQLTANQIRCASISVTGGSSVDFTGIVVSTATTLQTLTVGTETIMSPTPTSQNRVEMFENASITTFNSANHLIVTPLSALATTTLSASSSITSEGSTQINSITFSRSAVSLFQSPTNLTISGVTTLINVAELDCPTLSIGTLSTASFDFTNSTISGKFSVSSSALFEINTPLTVSNPSVINNLATSGSNLSISSSTFTRVDLNFALHTLTIDGATVSATNLIDFQAAGGISFGNLFFTSETLHSPSVLTVSLSTSLTFERNVLATTLSVLSPDDSATLSMDCTTISASALSLEPAGTGIVSLSNTSLYVTGLLSATAATLNGPVRANLVTSTNVSAASVTTTFEDYFERINLGPNIFATLTTVSLTLADMNLVLASTNGSITINTITAQSFSANKLNVTTSLSASHVEVPTVTIGSTTFTTFEGGTINTSALTHQVVGPTSFQSSSIGISVNNNTISTYGDGLVDLVLDPLALSITGGLITDTLSLSSLIIRNNSTSITSITCSSLSSSGINISCANLNIGPSTTSLTVTSSFAAPTLVVNGPALLVGGSLSISSMTFTNLGVNANLNLSSTIGITFSHIDITSKTILTNNTWLTVGPTIFSLPGASPGVVTSSRNVTIGGTLSPTLLTFSNASLLTCSSLSLNTGITCTALSCTGILTTTAAYLTASTINTVSVGSLVLDFFTQHYQNTVSNTDFIWFASGSTHVSFGNSGALTGQRLSVSNNTISTGASFPIIFNSNVSITTPLSIGNASGTSISSTLLTTGTATLASFSVGNVTLTNLTVATFTNTSLTINPTSISSTGNIVFSPTGTAGVTFQNSSGDGLIVKNNTLTTLATNLTFTNNVTGGSLTSTALSCSTGALTTLTVNTTTVTGLFTGATVSITGTQTLTSTNLLLGSLSIVGGSISNTVLNQNVTFSCSTTGATLIGSAGTALTITNNTWSSGGDIFLNGSISTPSNLGVATLIGASVSVAGTVSATTINSTLLLSANPLIQTTANSITCSSFAFGSLSASTNILQATATDGSIVFFANGTGGVLIQKSGDANILTITNNTLSTGAGNIVFSPSGSVTTSKNLTLSTLNAAVTLSATSLTANGAVSLTSLVGTLVVGSMTLSSPNTISITSGGSITLSTSGTGTVTSTEMSCTSVRFGSVTLTGGTVSSSVASLTLACASGDLVFNPSTGTVSSSVNASFGGVAIGTATLNASALLEMVSTVSGFGLPKMTTAEQTAITPVAAMEVYNASKPAKSFHNGTNWVDISKIGYNYATNLAVFSTSAGSFVDFTGLTDVTVTCVSTSSKVEVTFSSGVSFNANGCYGYVDLQRKNGVGGTYASIAQGTLRGSEVQCWIECSFGSENSANTPTLTANSDTVRACSGVFVDSPSYAGVVYYKIRVMAYNSVTTMWGGTIVTNNANKASIPSTLIVREILPVMPAFVVLDPVPNLTSTASSSGTLTLTSASNYVQEITGTAIHTIVLPSAATMKVGKSFVLVNNSTGIITVKVSTGPTFYRLIPPKVRCVVLCVSNTDAVAAWTSDVFSECAGGYAAFAKSASAQAISAITTTVVTFDATLFDTFTSNLLTNSAGRFTALVPMKLLVSASVRVTGFNTGIKNIWITQNSSATSYFHGQFLYNQTTGAKMGMTSVALLNMAANDYFETNIYLGTADSLGNTGGDQCVITIKQIH